MATTARFEPSHPPRVPGWVPGWQALYGERLRNVVHGVAEPAFDVLHKQRRVLNLRIHLVNSPDMIGHVLLDNQANYPRPPIARKVLRPFIGEGLLTAEGAAWKLQRRIVAGAFTPAAVGRLAGLMNDAARAQVQRWPARAVRMDLAPEATRLTMRVIAATLFAGDARLTAPEAGAHIARIIAASGQPRPLALLGVGHLDPSPSQIAVRHSARWLRQRIGVLVDDQGQDMAAGFFAELVRALRADYPRAEADALALDNALTFFVAGHENTATALAWGAYLFAAQPALQEQLRAEAVAALTGSSAALSRCCASFWTKPCGFTHRWRRSRGRRWPMMTCAVCTYARAICWRSTRGWSTAIAGCGTIRTPLTSPAFRQKTAPRRTVSNTCRSERGRASAWGCALPRVEALVILAHWLAARRFRLPAGFAPLPYGSITLRPYGGMMLDVEPLGRSLNHVLQCSINRSMAWYSMSDSSIQPESAHLAAPEPFVMSRFEFVAMMAMLMALQALACDAMLPAIGTMARDLGESDPNRRQLVIGLFLLASGLGSLIPGTIADRVGRRPVVLTCLALYIALSLACAAVTTFNALLFVRILLGLACSGLAVMPGAILRDRYSGDTMARMSSTISSVFMIVPILAPSVGQAVLLFGGWRWIFAILGVFGSVVGLWCVFRLPESLHADHRQAATPMQLLGNMRDAATHRGAMGYVIGSALVFGAMLGYINSSQQLVAEHFGAGSWFPLLFGGTAVMMSMASFTNSRIVERFGARRVSHTALIAFIFTSALQLLLASQPHETIWQFMPVLSVNLCLIGFIGANFGSISLQPFARIAGAASSVQAFTRMVLGSLLGIYIGQAFDGSARPLAIALLSCGLVALALVLFSEHGKLFRRLNPPGTPRPVPATPPR